MKLGLRTDEARELERWRAIVGDVLDDVADREGCFDYLYEHFARPDAWRLADGAEGLLQQLDERGLTLGLASNFDQPARAARPASRRG